MKLHQYYISLVHSTIRADSSRATSLHPYTTKTEQLSPASAPYTTSTTSQ